MIFHSAPPQTPAIIQRLGICQLLDEKMEGRRNALPDRGLAAMGNPPKAFAPEAVPSSSAGRGAVSRRLGLTGMDRAGAVGTQLGVPPVAVARDPGVDLPRHEVNPWNQQEPRHEFPAG